MANGLFTEDSSNDASQDDTVKEQSRTKQIMNNESISEESTDDGSEDVERPTHAEGDRSHSSQAQDPNKVLHGNRERACEADDQGVAIGDLSTTTTFRIARFVPMHTQADQEHQHTCTNMSHDHLHTT